MAGCVGQGRMGKLSERLISRCFVPKKYSAFRYRGPAEDLTGWFGPKKCLTRWEQLHIERELSAMVDAESSVERLKPLEQIRSDMS